MPDKEIPEKSLHKHHSSGKALRSWLVEQQHIKFIGVFKQLLGGAMSWVTIFIFIFSGLSAWNTDTMARVRDVFPWLNIGVFAAVVFIGLVIAMWLEHKWFQPSVMAYWNNMFYNQGNEVKTNMENILKKLSELEEEVKEMKGNNEDSAD